MAATIPRAVAILAAVSGITMVACRGEDAQDASHARPDAEAHSELRFSNESRLTFDGPGGDPLFGVANAAIMDDRVFIADAGSHRLLGYLQDGRLLFAVGRNGEGPGEFREVSTLHAAGGLIRVFDRALRRITEFDEDGTLVSLYRVSVPEPFLSVDIVGYLADGNAVGLLYRHDPRPIRGQIVRTPAVVAVLDSAGTSVLPLESIPLTEKYVEPYGRGGVLQKNLPFGKATGVVVLGRSVAISDGNDWTIKLVDIETGDESILAPPGDYAPAELDLSQLAHIQQQTYIELLDQRVDNERLFLEIVFRPPYGWLGLRMIENFLVVANDGSLWAAMVTAPDEGAQWRVFGKAGDIRNATSAEPVELLAVADGLAVAKRHGPLDEEFIDLYVVEGSSN